MKNEFDLQILNVCEVGDIGEMEEADAKDFTILALQELKPNEAAEILLKLKFGEKLSKGQRQNLSHEMQEERIWEEYRDLSYHEMFYSCASLLYEAFPKNFPEANAAICTVEITPKTTRGINAMEKADEALILRILADSMSDRSILNRFFKDELEKPSFPEAEHIIWQYEITKKDNQTYQLELYSSWYWLGALDDVSVHTSVVLS
jgi:hypothetical protein